MRTQFNRKLLCFLLLFSGFSYASTNQSIIGLWETIDDRTGQKKAIVQIEEVNHHIQGKIVKVYWKKGDNRICVACHGKLKNHPIKGIRFLWGLEKHSPSLWMNGKILDPHNGQIYQVRIKKQKSNLFVRAYLGIPMLGRTQVWHRFTGTVNEG